MEINEFHIVLFHIISVTVLKMTCFVLGFLTIRFGYYLVRDGITGQFKFSTKFQGISADLQSVSPGLLFLFLGIFLIGYAMFVEKTGNFRSEERIEQPINEPGLPTTDQILESLEKGA